MCFLYYSLISQLVSCILCFQLWSARDYKPIKSLAGHESKVTSLDISGGTYGFLCPCVYYYIIINSETLFRSNQFWPASGSENQVGLLIIEIVISDRSLSF
jgi:hypothetical protein